MSTAIIDVTDASAMASWLREFDGRHPVDLLIANAGTSAGPDPDSPSEGAETAARQVGVNLLGAINTLEPLLPALGPLRTLKAMVALASPAPLPSSSVAVSVTAWPANLVTVAGPNDRVAVLAPLEPMGRH